MGKFQVRYWYLIVFIIVAVAVVYFISANMSPRGFSADEPMTLDVETPDPVEPSDEYANGANVEEPVLDDETLSIEGEPTPPAVSVIEQPHSPPASVSALEVVAVDPSHPEADQMTVRAGETLKLLWPADLDNENPGTVDIFNSIGSGSYQTLENDYPDSGLYIFRVPETSGASMVISVKNSDQTFVSSPIVISQLEEQEEALSEKPSRNSHVE